jgi:hypothetical protein
MQKISKEEIFKILYKSDNYCMDGKSQSDIVELIFKILSPSVSDIKRITHMICEWYSVNDRDFKENYVNFMQEKNDLYGYASLNPTSVTYNGKISARDSISTRIDDKLSRLKNTPPEKDSEDTILDIFGYCILLIHAINLEI